MNIDDSLKYLKELSHIMDRSLSMQKKITNFSNINYAKLLDNIGTNSNYNLILNEFVNNQMKLLSSTNSSIKNLYDMEKIFTLQWDAISSIEKIYNTTNLDILQKSLLQNDFTGLDIFVKSLNTQNISAPTLSFLKTAQIFDSFNITLPKGLPTILKNLHVETAENLAYLNNINLDVPSKSFYIVEKPYENASITETNILSSSLNLLEGIDEVDLIEFLNHLSNYPYLAPKHEVGEKILQIISAWDLYTDFEDEFYYHGRVKDINTCPYTDYQMMQAPTGVAGQGRYNNVGESHYYFSNKQIGAIIEVKRHSKPSQIQIAKLKPKRSIKMIDLSQISTAQCKFLEYCRYSPDDNDFSKIRREYLIPGFIATCCKYNNIDGIKYYGSKEYTNFVSWNHSYFDFVSYDIIDIDKKI